MPAAEALGAIATGAGALLGTGGSMIYNAGMTKKQRKWQEKMMDKQNEFSVNMWNKQNEYNSPSAQRQRLIEAGMNPLGADMASSTAEQLTSASAPTTSLPQIQNPNLGVSDAVMMKKQLELQNAQIANIDADTNLKFEETARIQKLTPVEVRQIIETTNKLKTDIEGSELDNEQKKIALSYADFMEQAKLNKVLSETAVNESLAKLNDASREKVKYELDNLMPLDRLQKIASIKETKVRTEKMQAEIAEINAKINQIVAETGLTIKDIKYYLWNHMPQSYKNAKGLKAFVEDGIDELMQWYADADESITSKVDLDSVSD